MVAIATAIAMARRGAETGGFKLDWFAARSLF